jgi:hypothetical protein
MEDSSIWDLTTSGRLQSISDSICPVHDFCLYYNVPNWFVRVECRRHAKKSSIRATQTGTICLLSEEKATEVPTLALFVRVEHPFFIYIHLALFASSHRGESRFAENHNPTSLEIIPSRRFPFRLWVRRRRRRILRCVEQFIEFF